MKCKRYIWIGFIILLFSSTIVNLSAEAISTSEQKSVYIIPVHETVEKGLLAFINRSIQEAEEKDAELIVLDINTPGGAVDAASDIAKSITTTELPLVAFVNKQALSAGAYIALNADEIYMTPGSTMGAAAIIDGQGNAAGDKAESFWNAAMESAAELNGRDPKYAIAMADKDIDLPEVNAKKGELLTLTPTQALEVGYSEGTVSSLDELLEQLGYGNHVIISTQVGFAENVARFLTNPVVVPILLSLGSIGLLLELYSPGFGIPGTVGISSLLLFFYGHTVAGLAGMEAIILFFVGFVLLVLELFVPGGILGIIGFAAVITSIFLTTGSFELAAISIMISLVACVVVSLLLFKVFNKNIKFFDRLILRDSTHTDAGYVSVSNRPELMGLEGKTLTPLRPAGTAKFNQEYLDVVSEGSFIQADVVVKIVKVEGARIVVREIVAEEK